MPSPASLLLAVACSMLLLSCEGSQWPLSPLLISQFAVLCNVALQSLIMWGVLCIWSIDLLNFLVHQMSSFLFPMTVECFAHCCNVQFMWLANCQDSCVNHHFIHSWRAMDMSFFVTQSVTTSILFVLIHQYSLWSKGRKIKLRPPPGFLPTWSQWEWN